MEDRTVDRVFDIMETVQFLLEVKAVQIGLQFPDSLLPQSRAVVKQLSTMLQSRLPDAKHQICILADTSYGSCCVDEVAAQHAKCDAIVHYGPACLSKTNRLPVYYVFGNAPLNVTHLITCLRGHTTGSKCLLIVYEQRFRQSMMDLEKQLQELTPQAAVPIHVGHVRAAVHLSASPESTDKNDSTGDGQSNLFGFEFPVPLNLSEAAFLFVGSQCALLTNFMVNYNANLFYRYDPEAGSDSLQIHVETSSVNKLLARRFYLMEKCKNADIIGIVVGTLAVEKYLEVIARIKRLIRAANKKHYMFVVGKINEAKLANFAEIDIYVLIACPFNSLLDSSNHFKDIVTPFELELALSLDREWDGSYSTDFRTVLASSDSEAKTVRTEEEEVRFSTVSRGIRASQAAVSEAEGNPNHQDALVLRESTTLSTIGGPKTASSHFASRAYKGLEMSASDRPASVEMGLSGLARSYATSQLTSTSFDVYYV